MAIRKRNGKQQLSDRALALELMMFFFFVFFTCLFIFIFTFAYSPRSIYFAAPKTFIPRTSLELYEIVNRQKKKCFFFLTKKARSKSKKKTAKKRYIESSMPQWVSLPNHAKDKRQTVRAHEVTQTNNGNNKKQKEEKTRKKLTSNKRKTIDKTTVFPYLIFALFGPKNYRTE